MKIIIGNNSDSCHVQKFADNIAIMGCIRSEPDEYQNLSSDFVKWCKSNSLHHNTFKTRKFWMVLNVNACLIFSLFSHYMPCTNTLHTKHLNP